MKANRSKGLTRSAGISLLLLVLTGAVLFWTTPVKAATNSLTTCNEATLRLAVTNASSGDTISFNCGGNATIYLNQVITINKDLTIDGSGPQITLDGQHLTEIFQVNFGVAFTIKSLTIANGQTFGGGVIFNRGTLTVNHTTFTNNKAYGEGSSIINSIDGTLTVSYSAFFTNQGGGGGAGGIANAGTANVTDTTFAENTTLGAGYGPAGGIKNYGGTLTVTNSTFSGNRATYNKIAGSGGIFNYGGTLSVTNSSFSGNSISPYNSNSYNIGGGIRNDHGNMTVTSSTFSNNLGGGIYNYGTAELKNTIIATSSGTNCSGSITDDGYNLEYSGSGSNSCGFSNHALSGDPLLAPLTDNGGPTQTLALLGGSPAIDAIPAASCTDLSNPPIPVTTDQRGVTRPQGSGCDIGAYEFQPGVAATRLVFSTHPSIAAVGLPFRDQPLLLAQANNGFIGTGFNGPVTLQIKPGTGTTGAVLAGPVTVIAVNGLVSFSGLSIDKVGTGYVLVASAGGLTGVESKPFDVAPVCSLQALKTITNSGGILDFKCPTDTTITLDTSLTVTKDLTLTNSGGGQLTISGASKYQIFFVNQGINLSLNNLNIEGAAIEAIYNGSGTLTVSNTTFSNNPGAGIYNFLGTMTVTNSTFLNNQLAVDNVIGTLTVNNSTFSGNGNTASYGGGINNSGGKVTVTNSTFLNNRSREGGGIVNDGNMVVANSTFLTNSADSGGGIFNRVNGTLSVTNSTLSGNSSTYEGGGIFNYGLLTVTNSTFSGNSATYYGGGIYNFFIIGGMVTVTNSTFSGNTATYQGGGIYNYFYNSGGTLTVTNSTFSGNIAPSGGGVYTNNGTVGLKNTIMANNSSNNCTGSITDQGYNLEYSGGNSNSCGFSNNALSGDPLLAPLADNGGSTQTMALLPGSPAVNAIPVAACVVSTDQRGVARPQGGKCDIGAFEQVPSIVSLDQFNRPNGSIGGNWQGNTGTGFFRIFGSAIQVANSGYLYWKTSFGANQEAGYTFTRISTQATEHDLILKGDGGDPLLGTAHLIEVQYNPAKKEVSINTQAPGRGWFTHIKFSGVTFGAGDRFRAKAYSSGLVEVYQNDKFIGSFNVTTGPKAWPTAYASAGGKIGVWFIGNFLSSEARFDDFGGGNF